LIKTVTLYFAKNTILADRHSSHKQIKQVIIGPYRNSISENKLLQDIKSLQ